MRIIYDLFSIRETAEVVATVNPSCFHSVDELCEIIKRESHNFKEPGYVNFGGWTLTAYYPATEAGKNHECLGVKASVDAYTVNLWLKSLKQGLNDAS